MQQDPRRFSPYNGERTADKLARLAVGDPAERVSLADMIGVLHDRAYGLLILILTLPNAVPGPFLPGLSALSGLPVALIGLQMVLGWPDPRLPGFLTRRAIERRRITAFLDRALPRVRRVERLFRPRYPRFADARADRWVGAAIAVLALVLAMPIPLGNLPPAWAIVIIAIGILENDGLAVIVGVVAGALAVAWNLFLVLVGAAALDHLLPTLL